MDTGVRVHDVDYCFITDGLIRFRDKIDVPDNNDLKKVILREFHVKSYSNHASYQKTLITMKKFYYYPNLRKDVAEFVARCLDCEYVKASVSIQVDCYS